MAARFVNIDHDTPLLLPPDCRARYKLRQQTVEPVFGIIKEARGFRRFSLRGQAKASLEWTLVSLAYKTASRSPRRSGTAARVKAP